MTERDSLPWTGRVKRLWRGVSFRWTARFAGLCEAARRRRDRLRLAAVLLLLGLAGTLLGNVTSEVFLEGTFSIWRLAVWLVSGAGSFYLAYLTVEGVQRLTGLSQARGAEAPSARAEVLILPVSLPISGQRGAADSKAAGNSLLPALNESSVQDALGSLHGFLTGGAGARDWTLLRLEGSKEGLRSSQDWRLEDLLPSTAVLRHRSTQVALSDFAWQQSWRALNEHFSGGEPQCLSEIILVVTPEADAYFNKFKEIIEKIIVRTTDSKIIISKFYLDTNKRLPEIENILRQKVERIVKDAPQRRIAIDITGGDRIYAVASALVTMQDRVVMTYVRPTIRPGEHAHVVDKIDVLGVYGKD